MSKGYYEAVVSGQPMPQRVLVRSFDVTYADDIHAPGCQTVSECIERTLMDGAAAAILLDTIASEGAVSESELRALWGDR